MAPIGQIQADDYSFTIDPYGHSHAQQLFQLIISAFVMQQVAMLYWRQLEQEDPKIQTQMVPQISAPLDQLMVIKAARTSAVMTPNIFRLLTEMVASGFMVITSPETYFPARFMFILTWLMTALESRTSTRDEMFSDVPVKLKADWITFRFWRVRLKKEALEQAQVSSIFRCTQVTKRVYEYPNVEKAIEIELIVLCTIYIEQIKL
ncbi:Hypothetical_protein [Hexamita inflata]|uniref:Hypothetical_protein n=1 Tax=Hexamita inflata TaxID=28002 RepID=A0ABP1GIT0_9EUKA